MQSRHSPPPRSEFECTTQFQFPSPHNSNAADRIKYFLLPVNFPAAAQLKTVIFTFAGAAVVMAQQIERDCLTSILAAADRLILYVEQLRAGQKRGDRQVVQ